MNKDPSLLRGQIIMRKIGKIGEKILSLWATNAGATCISSTEDDEKGWDYLLEFSYNDSPSTQENDFAESLVEEVCAFVQVKSTANNNKAIPIELQHLKRHIEKPSPVFFLIFEFEKKATPQRAYLVEVGKNLMEQVLKKIRLAESKKLKKIKKMTMNLKYGEEHRLDELSGAGLLKKIREYCKPNPKEYSKRKLQMLSTLGYGERPVTFKVTFQEDDPQKRVKDLIAFSLGELDSIPISKFESFETRFGIEKPKSASLADLKFKVPKLPTQTLKIVLQDEFRSNQIEFTGNGYFPGQLFPFIPTELWRVKIKSDYLEINVSMETKRLNLTFICPDESAHLSISEWINVFKVLDLFVNCGSNGISIEAKSLDGKTAIKEVIKAPPENLEEMKDLHEALIALRDFAFWAKISNDQKISIHEIMSQKIKLINIVKVVKNKKSDAGISVALLDNSSVKASTAGVFYHWNLTFGEKVVFTCMSSCGKVAGVKINEDNRTELDIEPIETEAHTSISLTKDEIHSYDFRKTLANISEKFVDLDLKVII